MRTMHEETRKEVDRGLEFRTGLSEVEQLTLDSELPRKTRSSSMRRPRHRNLFFSCYHAQQQLL